MNWRGIATPADRFWACLPYLLPLFDAHLMFSEPFYLSFPVLQPLWAVLFILSLPYRFVVGFLPAGIGGFLLFLAMYLLVVQNLNIARFIRYNTMQSIILGIVLSLCSIVWVYVLAPIVRGGLIQETIFNVIYLGTVGAVGFCIVQCVRGIYAEIPTISEAARVRVP